MKSANNRGNFWEYTFKPSGWTPVKLDVFPDSAMEGQLGRENTVMRTVPHNRKKKKFHRKNDRYKDCDFSFDLDLGSFSNCSFENCRFTQMEWQNVKFNNCDFKKCDFTFATLKQCSFLDNCSFKQISASAEHFKMIETSISASCFLQAIGTNLEHLPSSVDADYQKHRLVASKAKISRMVFTSTKNQPDLGLFFQANKELVLHSLAERVEKWRYTEKQKNSFVWAEIWSLPQKLEYTLAFASGWLTDWGQSVVRALAFFVGLVVFFAALYYFFEQPKSVSMAALKSFEISVVAGYTSHRQAHDNFFCSYLMGANLFFGLYWYSLIIPTIVRRVLR